MADEVGKLVEAPWLPAYTIGEYRYPYNVGPRNN